MFDLQTARGAPLSDGPSGQERSRLALLAVVACVVLLVDAVSKHLAVVELSERSPVELVDGVLTLRLVRNSGAAFGFASGLTVVFTAVAVFVVVVILRAARRLHSTAWAAALGLVLGGALGNLLDRIFREPGVFRGRVVDFLELPHWPVVNLADSAIVAGGALLVVLSLRGVRHDGQHAGGE
ncbi:MAG: signal peptidase II [Propionibacteriales bacterium]|nr:signal peptidase II [Propionibacteriales bacterium]